MTNIIETFPKGGGGKDNVVDAYYNPTDGLFYEEQTYTTPITGKANVIYFDISTNDQYKWDGSHFICVNTRSRELTSAEYDALSTAEKKNGAVYYINDGVTDGIHIAKTGFTPVGALIPMSGNKVPAYYLACDGTVYNIADYPELANYYKESQGSANFYGGDGTTTFAVPDLRGEFLRGTGTNSHTGQGSGANVGEHQDGTVHTAINSDNTAFYVRKGWNSSTADSVVGSAANYGQINLSNNSVTVQNFTSRPTNTSVLWCVASKNIYVDAGCDYSTEEKVVGTWIDGKTIYQKSYTFVLPNVVTDYTPVKVDIPTGVDAIDIVTSIEGGFYNSSIYLQFNNSTGTLTSGLTFNASSIFYDKNINSISVMHNRYLWNGRSAFATIQYTKTT